MPVCTCLSKNGGNRDTPPHTESIMSYVHTYSYRRDQPNLMMFPGWLAKQPDRPARPGQGKV